MERVRFDVLDGLRGVAAFAVLVMHVTPYNAILITPHAALARWADAVDAGNRT